MSHFLFVTHCALAV